MAEKHSSNEEEDSFSLDFDDEDENLPQFEQTLKKEASMHRQQQQKNTHQTKQKDELKQPTLQQQESGLISDSDPFLNSDSSDGQVDEHQKRLEQEKIALNEQSKQKNNANTGSNQKESKQAKSISKITKRKDSNSDLDEYDDEDDYDIKPKKITSKPTGNSPQQVKKVRKVKQGIEKQQRAPKRSTKKNTENNTSLNQDSQMNDLSKQQAGNTKNQMEIQQGGNTSHSLGGVPQVLPIQQQQVNHQKLEVQAGYENKEALTVLTRQVLETTDLRNFHNWIKSVIIKKYSDARKQYIKGKEDLAITQNQLYVLEIACGMGGDLKKWLHADIAFYVGVDIAFNSLQEAHRRAREMIEKLRPDEAHKRFRYGFYQKDGSDPSEVFWKHIQEPEQEKDYRKRIFFDIVSCQMAMHYMFGSERTARNFFENASSKLNNFGYLLLTFSDANAIVKKMRSRSVYNEKLKKHIFENKYFSMAFDSLEFPVGKPYGLSYGFFLQDAVGKKDQQTGVITYTPEYLVELNNLQKLALEYSLDLKENLNFIDFYKTYRNSNKELFQTMRLNQFSDGHPSIDPDLWEISHCYRVAVFQKIDPSGNVDKKYAFSRSVHTKHLHPEPVPQPPVLNPGLKIA